MKKVEIYEVLYAMGQLFARVEKIKWQRYERSLKLEQEYEARAWKEAQEETTTE